MGGVGGEEDNGSLRGELRKGFVGNSLSGTLKHCFTQQSPYLG